MTERPAFSHPLHLKWNGKSQKSHESLYLPESLRIKKVFFHSSDAMELYAKQSSRVEITELEARIFFFFFGIKFHVYKHL